MEVDSDGIPPQPQPQPRKRVRKPRAKQESSDAVKQPGRGRAPAKGQMHRAPQILLTDGDFASVSIPRSASRSDSMTCARCREFNWIERCFNDPEPADKVQVPAPAPQAQRKKVATTAELFSWNLSLAERSQRDSRSTLPTFKCKPPAPRRASKGDSSADASKGLREINRFPVSMEPSTSSVSPGSSAVSTDDPQRSQLKPRSRRRRNGAVSNCPSDGRNVSGDPSVEVQDANFLPPPVKKKATSNAPLLDSANCARICPLPARRVSKGLKNSASAGGTDSGKSRKCDPSAMGDWAASEKKKSASNGLCSESARSLSADKEEQREKNLLAKRAMEELLKGENLAPIEMIVAEAISKDPLGFVHSLRDSKLLKSLEKLGQQRKLGVSTAESKALRKQRKKERKREKREKRKQKRLIKLAANCGVSIEQLELEMSMDRSDSRGSAPRSSPLSLNGSLLGSSSTPAPSLLATSVLSNLPGPSPSSYLNVFPRPSFVPDPLNPLRNLAADRADSSGTGTPNTDGFSPLILPPPPIPTPTSTCQAEETEMDSQVVEEEQPSHSGEQGTASACATDGAPVPAADEHVMVSNEAPSTSSPAKVSKECEEGNGATPEDEEDEQNAIAISHLFPQLDALQQLKLIQMCTDNESSETDEHREPSGSENADLTQSSKVARTIALIKEKVKDFKEINGMQQVANEENEKEATVSQGSENGSGSCAVRTEEEEDVDVEDVRGNDAFLEEVRRNAKDDSWAKESSSQKPSEDRSTVSDHPAQSEKPLENSTLATEEAVQPTAFVSAPSPEKEVNSLSNCITGMADMGFGLQPRMLSILDEPLTTAASEHAPHRTAAAVISEVPLMEDDEHIYTTEMKVIPDWFNHAPYGAGAEAHMRYWESVKQRVLVADWIRKLQQHRSEHMLNHTRSRLHLRNGQRSAGTIRRSKSTEPWWPRNLFEQYEGALDIAGKVMRSAETPFGSYECDVPLINNLPIKVIRLDDDDTATLAYFRPGSPLTVSDPTEDYQSHVLAQDLDDATVVPKGVVQQMGLGKDDEKMRYLPWMKVKKLTPERSLGNSTRPPSCMSTKSTPQLAPAPTVEMPSEAEQREAEDAGPNPEVPDKNFAEASAYNVFSQKAYPALKQPVYNAMLMLPSSSSPQIHQQMPLIPQQYLPTSLPPLSTVLDGLQPSTSGLPYLHMPQQQHQSYSGVRELPCMQQTVNGHAVQSGYCGQVQPAGQMFYGNSSDIVPACRDGAAALQEFTGELSSTPHQPNYSASTSSGLTKDTIVDQEMEDFFCAVFDECQMRSSARLENVYMDEDADPFLTMEQLT